MTELEGNLRAERDDPLSGTQGSSEGAAAPLSCLPQAAGFLPWSRTAECVWRGKEVQAPAPTWGGTGVQRRGFLDVGTPDSLSRREDSESGPRTRRPRSPSETELEPEGPCSLPSRPAALALHFRSHAKIPLQSRGPAPCSYRTWQNPCPSGPDASSYRRVSATPAV